MTPPPKLLGSYSTPPFSYGEVVACARRGDVRIVGVSSGPIPWPVGQRLPKGRGRALVLYAGLAEAVRRESAEAVGYYWGVTAQTVTAWRGGRVRASSRWSCASDARSSCSPRRRAAANSSSSWA